MELLVLKADKNQNNEETEINRNNILVDLSNSKIYYKKYIANDLEFVVDKHTKMCFLDQCTVGFI